MMGISHGYGQDTEAKQEDFKAALSLLFMLWRFIFRKWEAQGTPREKLTLEYIGLNAGYGVHPQTGEDGSPLIALAALDDFRATYGYDFRATLYENNPDTYSHLIRNIPTHGLDKVHAVNDNHNAAIGKLPKKPWQFGVIYSDPNDGSIPVDLLAYCNDVRPRTDIILSVLCNGRKRKAARMKRIDEELRAIGKEHWLVREVLGKWQHTLLVGTNCPDFPEPTARRRFYLIESTYGRHLLNLCSYSKAKYDAEAPGQMPLFLPAPTPYATYEEYLRQPRYRAIREIAMERDDYTCQRCLEAAATEVHHKRYPPWWGTATPEECYDVPENLIPVCHPCHCEIEGKEN